MTIGMRGGYRWGVRSCSRVLSAPLPPSGLRPTTRPRLSCSRSTTLRKDLGAGVRTVYGRDPDGNVLELHELSPAEHAFALPS
jgi:hypothetical protein